MTFRQRSLFSPIAACLLTTSLFLPWSTPAPQGPLQTVAAAAGLPISRPDPVMVKADMAAERRRVLTDRIVASYEVAPALARKIVTAAHEIGGRERVDPVLLLALVGVESRFQPEARNPSGAIGLTQTIPRWHPEKVAAIQASGKSLTDPEANLAMGAKILAEYTRMSRGDRMRGLQRYNGALGDERQRYARKVMVVYERLSHRLPTVDNRASWIAMERSEPPSIR